jgi:nucleoside-diphosphate-sugar epimerase
VELAEADLMVDGSYDEIFAGCSAVFHVAANFGTDPRWAAATDVVGRLSPIDGATNDIAAKEEAATTSYDQGVYDSLVVATERVLRSIEQSSGSVQRLVYTSSFAAIGGPGSYANGHQVSEADWAGAGPYISAEHMMQKHSGRWTAEDNAYGKGKTDCEIIINEWGPRHGVECISSCPSVVLGPLLSPAHDMTWQH